MRTLTLHLSETIDLNDKEAKMVLAYKLYELGKLSLGQAAELVGYWKETFMELLQKVFDIRYCSNTHKFVFYGVHHHPGPAFHV